jgi:hypothetical protein
VKCELESREGKAGLNSGSHSEDEEKDQMMSAGLANTEMCL